MNYYKEIKNELINNEVYKRVKDYSKNRNDLFTYYNVGKLLVEAQGGEKRAKYGDGLIKEYSKRLTVELGIGYSFSALKRMRQFYLLIKKGVTMSHQLTWSHYVELVKINDVNSINYYIFQVIHNNLSVRNLRYKIKNNEYERLSEETKEKINQETEYKVEDFIKNPIFIKNSYRNIEISEKILKQLILEDLDNFLKELGEDFCYLGQEVKIKIGAHYHSIDILLYNIKFTCYVVIELKVTELKAEHIGQIQKYMNYIDKNIKKGNQEKTIGIIICKRDNKFLMEYCSDDRVFRTNYQLI